MSRLGLTAKVDTQKQVVTVNPVNNINVSVRSPSEIQNTATTREITENEQSVQRQLTDETQVIYPDSGIYVQPTQENIDKLTADLAEQLNINEALKIIIGMYQDNPIFVNKLVLTDDEKLAQLVKLMTNADSVTVDAEDLGSGCCTGNKYRKVNAIYVKHKDTTETLKYDYPKIMQMLKELGINTKIVW